MNTNDFPDIISSAIIPSQYDVEWQQLPPIFESIMPKPVLFLVQPLTPDSPDEKIVIEKLIRGCGISEHEYNLLFPEPGTVSWNKIREHCQPATVVLIGILPSQLGIDASFVLNEVNFFDHCIFIPTVSVAAMELNKAHKEQLWNKALKPVLKDKVITLPFNS